jgi:ribose 5-phosphate isomerase B
MKIALGADHAGFELKESLRSQLEKAGHELVDFGTDSPESVDYPDFASQVANDVASGAAERGILVCSTGVGMSMAANKVDGVRAAMGTVPDEVRLTRQHNDANVLTLGARYLDTPKAMELVNIFLETGFDGGRHARRVAKIMDLEKSGN